MGQVRRPFLALLAGLLILPGSFSLIGHDPCVSTSKSSTFSFPLVASGGVATVLTSPDDWPVVNQIAAPTFASDVGKVTGSTPSVVNTTSVSLKTSKGGAVLIAGTVDHSSLIASLGNTSSIVANLTASVRGQWEAYAAAPITLSGGVQAYVLVGSDRRGTVYGLYELSEQIGVSPWWWWADVPVQKKSTVYLSSCSHGSPAVKYRGIFINDEQPALQGWAQEKFTNGTGPAFNHFVYSHVFDLLNRLRINYFWPAMWQGMFYVDDLENGPLADLHAIVMGTSHQEPMARSTPNELNIANPPVGPWNFTTNAANLTAWWTESVQRSKNWETVYTIGMRGTGDLPLSTDTNIQNMETIIQAQRGIFENVFNTSNPATVPQMWCLYSEVEGYYDDGMAVPDDVILLWADDNWGNVRRFPLTSERQRSGGAGVYYHVDYVGAPVDYKWVQTTQLNRVYEQMSLALSRNSTAMWILNVGDLKPNELNIEFFHALGYQPSLFTPNNIESWVAKWATREFGLNTIQSNNIATIVANLTRYSARRKPELMNTTVFSLTNYHEAERVLTEWQTLYDASLAIYNALPSLTKPAFFQLVHHPITGFLQTYNLWIAVGRNNLFASQIRTSANDQADLALSWFNAAWELENEYHTMLDGKWDQMMSQPHIGYVYWQQPLGNSMPPVNRIMAQKPGMSGPMRMTLESRLGAWPGDNQNNCAQGYNCPDPVMDPLDPYMPTPSRYVDLSLAGPAGVTWKATTNATWLTITPSSGSLSTSHNEQRVVLTANWAKVGSEESLAQVVFTPTNAKNVSWLGPMNVYLPAIPRSVPAGFHGVVEGDGGISIEASSYTKITPSTVGNATWIVLPGFGRTKDAVTISPNDGSTNYTIGSGPSIQYSFYNFDSYANNTAYLTTYVSPSMNANGADQPLAFALQVDGGTPVRVQPVGPNVPGQFPTGWGSMTGPQSNNIIPTLTNITIAPGAHTLTLWGIESAVVIQKFVIDTGNVRTSYLGPPASIIV